MIPIKDIEQALFQVLENDKTRIDISGGKHSTYDKIKVYRVTDTMVRIDYHEKPKEVKP